MIIQPAVTGQVNTVKFRCRKEKNMKESTEWVYPVMRCSEGHEY